MKVPIKKKIFKKFLAINFTVNFLLLTSFCFSQGISINSTAASADPSAMLDVSSTNAGILIPRMTEAQKNGITSPATGLMIYQTDATTGFWYYNGTAWIQSVGATGPTGLLSPGSYSGNTPYWDGTQWVVTSSNIFNNGNSVGIGTSSPDASSKVEIASTNSGFLIPRMTTAERNAISNPAQGLQIINTTTNCIEVYFNPIWQNIYCGCNAPSSPPAGTHTPSETQITWNWGSISGATGYKYNTVNNFNTATDNGTNTSYIQAGLACNTSYTLYIWSYSNCGNSSAATLNQTTSPCFTCGVNNITFTYKGSTVTYGTVSGSYNSGQYCWLDRNLGATAVATAIADVAGYGDLFQWGRLDDGHQTRTSATTSILSSNDVPGHTKFITSSNDWRSSPNDALWQGKSGINNPCPAGWRLPTETELDNERTSWGQNNINGAITSPLKLPAAGLRLSTDGSPYGVGNTGYYWSSTAISPDTRILFFNIGSSYINTYYRANGISVRCLRDY